MCSSDLFADLGLSEPESALLGGVLARPARLVVVAGLTPSGRLSTVRALAARASEPHRDTVVVGRRSGPEIVAVQRVVGEGESFDATAMEALSRGGGVVALEDVRHRRLFRSAVESALEGPLVIASMPAGGAAEALGLLLEALGESEESRWDLAACLGAVVVHRTVRLLCPHCREEVAAPAEALAKLGAPSDAGTRCSRPVGCDRCSGSGYAGTGGIVSIETLAGQPTRLLRAGAPIAEVEAAAAKGCIRTLLQAGLERVRAGQTSLAELARVL